MQSLKLRTALRNPVTWGAGGIAFATVVALVLGYIYYNPPGQGKLVTFYTADAAQISQGDDVRMAGITVGKVKDTALESKRVRVRARINDDAFVGDQSQIEVRMLTVVGGYYVNINSIGDRPLGAEPIPAERVKLPYILTNALEDTIKVTSNVATKPINESLNAIQKGLKGTNVEALAAIVDAGNSIMSSVDKQRGEVTKILNVSNEYVRALTNYRGELVQLIRKIAILTQTLTLYGKGLEDLINGLGETTLALKPVGDFYETHRVEFIERVRQFIHRTRLFVERNGVTVRLLQRLQNLFDRVLNAQDANPGLLATDLCIPMPGSTC
jgi:phospholipid/cholesterol/gamma-HCH transport system substrate-binding protein